MLSLLRGGERGQAWMAVLQTSLVEGAIQPGESTARMGEGRGVTWRLARTMWTGQ
jgi:hypothetical protein